MKFIHAAVWAAAFSTLVECHCTKLLASLSVTDRSRHVPEHHGQRAGIVPVPIRAEKYQPQLARDRPVSPWLDSKADRWIDLSDPNLRCNVGGRSSGGTQTATIAAGSSLTWVADQSVYHQGPVSFFMTKVPSAASADGSTPWFKIKDLGPTFSGGQAKWPMAKTYSVQVPACLAAGEYLMRIQQLGIHNPGGSPQFYISECLRAPRKCATDDYRLCAVKGHRRWWQNDVADGEDPGCVQGVRSGVQGQHLQQLQELHDSWRAGCEVLNHSRRAIQNCSDVFQ
jgi:hypothetical protein